MGQMINFKQVHSYNQLLYFAKIANSKYFYNLEPFTFLDLEREMGFHGVQGDARKLFYYLREIGAFYVYRKLRNIIEYKINKKKFIAFFEDQQLFIEFEPFLKHIRIYI